MKTEGVFSLKDVIFDKSQNKKLAVLEYLMDHNSGSYTLHTLSTALDFSSKSITLLCDEIQTDFVALNFGEFVNSQNKITWPNQNYQHNVYLQYLVRDSLPYQFLLATLIQPHLTNEEFCQQHFVSRATLARKLAKLAVYLQQFDIKMNLAQLKLTGHETLIRIIYTYFLWTGYLESDFEKLEEVQLEIEVVNQLDCPWLNHLTLKEKLMILLVSRIRLEQNYFLPATSIDSLTLPADAQGLQDYLSNFVEDQVQQQRNTHFLFCQFIYFPHFTSHSDYRTQLIYQEYLKKRKEEDYRARLTDQLTEFIVQEFLEADISSEVLQMLQVNLFATVTSFYLVHGALPTFNQLSAHVETVYPEYLSIHKKISHKMKLLERRQESAWLKKCHEAFVKTITLISYRLYIKAQAQPKLRVAIVSSPNFVMIDFLTFFLEQIQFVEMVYPTQQKKRSDCYLTTFPKLLTAEQTPYYVIPLRPESDFKAELFDFLWTTYLKKYILPPSEKKSIKK